MHAQAVIALAAEGRDQRRMDVDDPVFPLLAEGVGQDGHEAGQHNQVNFALLQKLRERRGVVFPIRKVLAAQHAGRDTGLGRALERERIRIGGKHEAQAAAGDLAPALRVDERL